MQDSLELLESQLAEKEQLVAALTERLEQAAEQLDRLHRTGADRALRAGFTGIPPELIEQQQKLVDDLQRAVQQWEEMQPGAFFGRIESQLAEVRQLVVHLEPGSNGAAELSSRNASDRYSTANAEGHRRSPSDSPQSILNYLKPSLLSDSETPSDATSDEPVANNGGSANAALPSHIDLPPLQDPPTPIDIAAAPAEELREACEARDGYIVYLMQRLRQLESQGHVPNSWTDLEGLPEEQHSRLDSLEKRLQATLRLTEVELSLQRAKLAREESRIRALDEQAQKELKRARQATDDAEEEKRGETSGGRWKRMLGRRANDA